MQVIAHADQSPVLRVDFGDIHAQAVVPVDQCQRRPLSAPNHEFGPVVPVSL